MKSKEMSVYQRWRAIGFLDTNPNITQCAEMYGFCYSTIWDLQKKYKETGDVADLPRKGRPSIEPMIINEIEKEGASLRNLAEKLSISKTSVEKYAHDAELNFRRYEEVPKFTETHIKKRMDFCKKYRHCKFENWFFADESYLYLFRNTMGK